VSIRTKKTSLALLLFFTIFGASFLFFNKNGQKGPETEVETGSRTGGGTTIDATTDLVVNTLDVTNTSTLSVPVTITGTSTQALLIEDGNGQDTFRHNTDTASTTFWSKDGVQEGAIYFSQDASDTNKVNDLIIENLNSRDIHLIGSAGENQVFIQDRLVREGDNNTYVEFGSDSYQFVAGGVNYVRFEEFGGQDVAEFNWNDEDVDYLMHSDNGSDILFLEAGGNGGRGALHRLSLDAGIHDGIVTIENTTSTVNTNTTTLVTLAIEDNNVYHIKGIANAVQGDDSNYASYEFRATVYRNGGNAVLLNDLNTKVHAEETGGATAWDAFIDVSGTNAVFQVIGVNSSTWAGFFEYTNVSVD